MTEGAHLLRKAKDEAYKLLVSDHNLDMRDDYGKLDLSAARHARCQTCTRRSRHSREPPPTRAR